MIFPSPNTFIVPIRRAHPPTASWWVQSTREEFTTAYQQELPRILQSSSIAPTASDGPTARQQFKARQQAHPAAE